MSLEMLFVFLMILIMLGALIFELANPAVIVFTVLMLFLLTGILTTEEAISGFSNEGMLTVGLLFMVAGAIQKSGLIEKFMKSWLAGSKTAINAMLRFFVPVSVISAFLNNTPIVVMLTPMVKNWCEENGYAASKFLIPLSYVTILGGTITLIGTSTNLVVHGMLVDYGYAGFSLFDFSIVGIPITIAGLLYIFTVGYKLLPEHKGFKEQVKEDSKEYIAELIVEENYPYVNQSVEEAGLRDLKGLYLLEIIREKERIPSVRPTTTIYAGDRLIFSGYISTLRDIQQIKGLTLRIGTNVDMDELKNGNTKIVEAVVSHRSSVKSKSIKKAKFRSHYDAGVIAVHRKNERIRSKIGDIVLKPGDTLLLLVGSDFVEKYNQSQDFYVLTPLDSVASLHQEKWKGTFSVILFIIMLLLAVTGLLSMFQAMAFTVILLYLSKVISMTDVRKYVHFDVLLLIASSFGVGLAMSNSGLANWIAESLVAIGEPFGLFAILLLVFIITNLFTELITNSAAAVLMLPIGLEMANGLGLDPMGFAITIAISASASFITPIGYQTNLIVYGPGGYRFIDYIKIGTPLTLIVMIFTVVIVYYWWF